VLNPYFVMALFYLLVAVLTAFDSAATSFAILPWFNGLRWLRVHFIALGIVTETIFGALPVLTARRFSKPVPDVRWDIWATLNVGLLLLVTGIPIVNGVLIFTGGTLIFIAVTLLAVHLAQLGGRHAAGAGLKFYITGLAYLLLGIIVGTGLWIGWSEPLRIQVPIEVHIHANNWGFMSLVFAGLMIDVLAGLTGKPLSSGRTLTTVFWMMTLGALLLVIGPWLGGPLWAIVPGLVLHLSATLWLLWLVTRALSRAHLWSAPGAWHLVTAYAWILAPVLIAPLIILKVPGFPGAGIEATAPQALIYGWVLQFSFALVPYFLGRIFMADQAAQLGGSWWSLLLAHVGSAFIWASIFIEPQRALLHGAAYVLYGLAMLPIAWMVWRSFHTHFRTLQETLAAQAGQ
jgi:cytochrome c oxidase cbb3-type subunit I